MLRMCKETLQVVRFVFLKKITLFYLTWRTGCAKVIYMMSNANKQGEEKMRNYTQKEAAKEIRKIARENGMTFKKQNAYINGQQAYMFTNRRTGEKVITNCTFWSAYENCMNGYVESCMQVN